MGHDILGYNKAGDEIAYARFGMSNHNALVLYGLLDANHFYAGVSGTGESATFSITQIEKAIQSYNQLYENSKFLQKSDAQSWDKKQIQKFIVSCLDTAQNEGSVRVFFC